MCDALRCRNSNAETLHLVPDMTDQPDHRAERFAEQRLQMVKTQLQTRGIVNERVLAAMADVPREEFVRPADVDEAYADYPLAIGHGQTISQPFTVAFMCETAAPQAHERVLEIGTGSGYGAAVLSRQADHVHTVERFPELARTAAEHLRRLGYDNVTVHVADGSQGLPENAPFDVIIVTAAAPGLPDPYVEQLADCGRIVIPLGSQSKGQSLMLFTRNGPEVHSENLGGFTFVPLVGKYGSPPKR